MNETELKDFMQSAPELTFNPFEEAAPLAEKKEEPKPVIPPELDDSMLSPAEKKMVEDFASKIDLSNSSMILQYGVGAQKKIADFSETTLNNVRTKDLGEMGDMLAQVVTELKGFEEQEEEKGFLGFFKKKSNSLTNMKARYEKAEANVDNICEVLESHQIQLLKDVATLDKMYELNKTYFKELSMYILAGKKKLAKIQAEELPALIAKANTSALPEDAQAVNDLNSQINRFEKKIHDLELTRMVSLQMAPQIRLVQNNDTVMSEKIQSTIVNTIPLWKSQMVLSMGIAHSAQAAKAQHEVTDLTNQLLRKNAETLKMSSIEIAKESERGVVDMETLVSSNEMLISTLTEVMQIQQEGRQKRHEAELQLQKMEQEMKTKLLQTTQR
ncbi:MAG: toxic anion resistance protein [Lachnospiraceae bacterium]